MGPSAEAKTSQRPATGGATMSGAPSAGRPEGRAVRSPISQMALFAGAVRPTPLLKATARNVLDLPLLDGQTIGGRWQAALDGVSSSLPLRILTDTKSPAPASTDNGRTTVEPDDVAFLGTGGVLRAAAKGHEGKMLVATGGSVLTVSLAEVLDDLIALDADVALLAEHDGTPTGVMLVSADVMRSMPGAGYMDFKEQCLPGIAKRHRVRVARAAAGGRVCLPVRDREQYLAALSHLSGGTPFRVVEPEAEVSPTSRMRDAVVLAGARVGDEAVVARSILGPGALAPAGQVVTDAIVGGAA